MFQSAVCADRTSKSPKVGFDIIGIPISVEASRGFKVRIVYKIGKRPSESSVKQTNNYGREPYISCRCAKNVMTSGIVVTLFECHF